MRSILIFMIIAPLLTDAQDAERFQRALGSDNDRAMDRWMKHELHRHRKRQLISTPNGSYSSYAPTYDSLVAFLRRQPGVEDVAWDKFIGKFDIWPGHSNIGLRWTKGGQVFERCWNVQEGIPGTINFFGWHPPIRKNREQLKYKRALECPGFVEQQRRYCLGAR